MTIACLKSDDIPILFIEKTSGIQKAYKCKGEEAQDPSKHKPMMRKASYFGGNKLLC
jgi:hypothetical protein